MERFISRGDRDGVASWNRCQHGNSCPSHVEHFFPDGTRNKLQQIRSRFWGDGYSIVRTQKRFRTKRGLWAIVSAFSNRKVLTKLTYGSSSYLLIPRLTLKTTSCAFATTSPTWSDASQSVHWDFCLLLLSVRKVIVWPFATTYRSQVLLWLTWCPHICPHLQSPVSGIIHSG